MTEKETLREEGVAETVRGEAPQPKRKRSVSKQQPYWTKNRKRLLFYCCMIALPVLQVCVFYIGTNFNSVLLAFQKWNAAERRLEFAGLENFRLVFTGRDGAAASEIVSGIGNSVLAYFIGLAFSLGVGLPFANAI